LNPSDAAFGLPSSGADQHPRSARFIASLHGDGYYDIVASALSSDPERSRRSGRAIGVSEDRAYPSWRALIESEAGRVDRSDIVAVMTPNDSHYEICAAALDAGFHIICDKPLTTDLATAVDLARRCRDRPPRRVP